jgi:DNA-directed RNA polymerase sigma subunit (sigma70/sigma32)
LPVPIADGYRWRTPHVCRRIHRNTHCGNSYCETLDLTPETEAFLNAVDDLDRALDESLSMTQRMKERIQEIREGHASGRPLRELVPHEQRPLLVQLLTENANLLHSYGTRVRRTEARALHHEGMTMDEIARQFGVTRQRVSALLRDSAARD